MIPIIERLEQIYIIFIGVFKLLNLGITSIIVGAIIGYVISYFFKEKKELSFQYFYTPYHIDKINYNLYPEKDLKSGDLQRTHFVIWNSGNCIIEGSDIHQTIPLSINCGVISGVSSLKMSRVSNHVSCELVGNHIVLKFDYLKPNDGFIFQVIHKPNKKLIVNCDLKAAKKSIRKCGPIMFLGGKRTLKYPIILGVAGFFFGLAFYLQYGNVAISNNGDPISIMIFSVILVVLSIFISNRTFPSNLKINRNKLFYEK